MENRRRRRAVKFEKHLLRCCGASESRDQDESESVQRGRKRSLSGRLVVQVLFLHSSPQCCLSERHDFVSNARNGLTQAALPPPGISLSFLRGGKLDVQRTRYQPPPPAQPTSNIFCSKVEQPPPPPLPRLKALDSNQTAPEYSRSIASQPSGQPFFLSLLEALNSEEAVPGSSELKEDLVLHHFENEDRTKDAMVPRLLPETIPSHLLSDRALSMLRYAERTLQGMDEVMETLSHIARIQQSAPLARQPQEQNPNNQKHLVQRRVVANPGILSALEEFVECYDDEMEDSVFESLLDQVQREPTYQEEYSDYYEYEEQESSDEEVERFDQSYDRFQEQPHLVDLGAPVYFERLPTPVLDIFSLNGSPRQRRPSRRLAVVDLVLPQYNQRQQDVLDSLFLESDEDELDADDVDVLREAATERDTSWTFDWNEASSSGESEHLDEEEVQLLSLANEIDGYDDEDKVRRMADVDLGFPQYSQLQQGVLDSLFLEGDEDEVDAYDLEVLREAATERDPPWPSDWDEASSGESEHLVEEEIQLISLVNEIDGYDEDKVLRITQTEDCELFPTGVRYHWELNEPSNSQEGIYDVPDMDEESEVPELVADLAIHSQEKDRVIAATDSRIASRKSFWSPFTSFQTFEDDYLVKSNVSESTATESTTLDAGNSDDSRLYPTKISYHWKLKEVYDVSDTNKGLVASSRQEQAWGGWKRRIDSLWNLNPFRLLRGAFDMPDDNFDRPQGDPIKRPHHTENFDIVMENLQEMDDDFNNNSMFLGESAVNHALFTYHSS